MTRALSLGLPLFGTVLALAAAAQPSALGQAQPGLWQISGIPGASAPVRQCVADVALLARFEHRSSNCSTKMLRDAGNAAQLDYSCGPAGFGHSELTLLTPRSLRIATQGISEGLPFNYVLQAHRIADCPIAARH